MARIAGWPLAGGGSLFTLLAACVHAHVCEILVELEDVLVLVFCLWELGHLRPRGSFPSWDVGPIRDQPKSRIGGLKSPHGPKSQKGRLGSQKT